MTPLILTTDEGPALLETLEWALVGDVPGGEKNHDLVSAVRERLKVIVEAAEKLPLLGMAKVRVEVLRKIDAHDLDELIRSIYSVDSRYFCVEADQEWGRDEEHEVQANPEDIDEEKLTKWVEAKGKGGSYVLSSILGDLVRREVLEPGDYLVSTW